MVLSVIQETRFLDASDDCRNQYEYHKRDDSIEHLLDSVWIFKNQEHDDYSNKIYKRQEHDQVAHRTDKFIGAVVL